MWTTIGVAAAAMLAISCAGSSLRADLERVRAYSGGQELSDTSVPVDPLTQAEVQAILKKPLDADTAVRVAMLNNRDLRATLRDMGVERGQLMQAGVVANPTIEAELLPERNTTLELRVEYEISSLVLAPVRAIAASHDLQAARFRSAGAVVQLGFDVRSAFYAVQSAETRLAIGKTVLEAFAAGRDAAVALHKSGNIRELDLVMQDTAYERARVSVSQLELAAYDARESLQRLLGVYGDDIAWEVAGDLAAVSSEVPDTDAAETTALEASLDLKATRSRLEALARKAGYSQLKGWLPEIALDVHALYGNPESTPGTNGDWRLGGGVSVGVPLFDQQRGNTRVFEAQRDALIERYYGMAIKLRSHVRQARNRLRSAHQRAKQYQDVIVPAQAKLATLTLQQYNAMQIGVQQVLNMRREQLEIELQQVETRREYWTAKAAVDALVAGRQVTMTGITAIESDATPQGGH